MLVGYDLYAERAGTYVFVDGNIDCDALFFASVFNNSLGRDAN